MRKTATARELRRLMTTVKARSLKSSPMTSSWVRKIARGRKTNTVVRVEAVMAVIISWLPRMELEVSLAPFSRYRKMFSRMTILLSTSIPTPRASPVRVIRFRVNPAKYMNIRVMTIDTGMEKAIIRVVRKLRRKKKRIATASNPPKIAELETSSRLSRISVVES